MAKISLNKLCPVKNSNTIVVAHNDLNIEIIQYLPIKEKSALITAVMQAAIDNNGLFSPLRLEIYLLLNLVRYYTNINLTDTMYNEPEKTYDLLCLNQLNTIIINALPKNEYDFVKESLIKCVQDFVRYNNSAAGIMKQITTDYSLAEMNVDDLVQKLGDPTQFALVRDILSKLG